MQISRGLYFTAFTFVALGALLLADSNGAAQNSLKLKKSMYIQATAMGQSTQLGRSFSVTAIIEEFSPAEDQQLLMEAFNQKGNEGLVNALSKMHSKGRLAITGTLGGDLAYIRQFPMPDGGVKIRMITNRLLRFGEVWADSRSSDYNLSGMEVILSKDKKHNSGVLFPAAQLDLNKDNKLEIELYQNPWKLVNVQLR
ncbi:MAG TPA: hypothetical protein VLB68_13130 [Pyrinomonadaceae bacterium]|nr:hypothetical protein [Pyrinomonadaceae bacterium]